MASTRKCITSAFLSSDAPLQAKAKAMTNKTQPAQRGQVNCPLCRVQVPHHHDAVTVELERYARPTFEKWVRPRLRHNDREGIGDVVVHYGAALHFTRRDPNGGHYLENSIEAVWRAFAEAWISSNAATRRPLKGR